jgi:hypothetical protein
MLAMFYCLIYRLLVELINEYMIIERTGTYYSPRGGVVVHIEHVIRAL